MDVYFRLWVVTQCYLIYFIVYIISAVAIGSSFSSLLCPFDIPPSLGSGYFFWGGVCLLALL